MFCSEAVKKTRARFLFQKTNRQRRGSTSRIYSQPVLSSTRANAKCVAILLTGYLAFETAVLAIEDEMDDYFVKPCWHRPSGEACYPAQWPLGLVGTGSAPSSMAFIRSLSCRIRFWKCAHESAPHPCFRRVELTDTIRLTKLGLEG
jgi:hypothetical protein